MEPYSQGRRRSIGPRRRSGTVSHDGLGLKVLVEAERSPFSAVARPAVTPEGRVEVGADTVEVDVAGPDAPCHRLGPVAVAGDVAGQAVEAVIGDAYCIIVILIADQHENRSEDLLTGD